MKNNKRRMYLSVNEKDMKLFKELLLLINGEDKTFKEADLFSALLWHFCMSSQKFYEAYKGEENNER